MTVRLVNSQRSLLRLSWLVVLLAVIVDAPIARGEVVHATASGGGACRSMLDAASTRYDVRGKGVYVQHFDGTTVTGGLAGMPDRVTTDFAPGDSGHVCIGFHNRTGQPVSLAFATADFGAGGDGAPVPVATDEWEYGAGSWLTLPVTSFDGLAHGDVVWLDTAVRLPDDTAGGSAYAGVRAMLRDDDGVQPRGSGSQAQASPSVIVQVFFDVPGDITEGGEFVDVRAPRVVWWDGFDIGTVPVLDRLRGQGIAPIRWKWRNTGSRTDEVGGTVRITSTLGGKQVAVLEVPERVVLRDSARAFEATWSKDIPFVGRFRPTLEFTDSRGKAHSVELDPIWVIPSWWYILALVLAIAVPVWVRRRSRRRYRELLARVEAAETAHEDEDSLSDGYG